MDFNSGTIIEYFWDLPSEFGNQSWSELWDEFTGPEETGALYQQGWNNYDGSSGQAFWNVAGVWGEQNWSEEVQHYTGANETGALADETLWNNDGTIAVWGFDLSGGAWNDYGGLYDSSWQLMSETVWETDGDRVVTAWDYLDSGTWASATDFYDSAGNAIGELDVGMDGTVSAFGTTGDAVDPACDNIFAWNDPVVLNLAGQAVSTVALADSGVTFDMLGDGGHERTGWVASGEGFLVVRADVSGGAVNSSRAMLPTLSTLAGYGTGGTITPQSPGYDALAVWMPGPGGVGGTIETLAQLQIAEIDLSPTPIDLSDNSNRINNGFVFRYSDGTTGQGAEVSFALGPELGSTPAGPDETSIPVIGSLVDPAALLVTGAQGWNIFGIPRDLGPSAEASSEIPVAAIGGGISAALPTDGYFNVLHG